MKVYDQLIDAVENGKRFKVDLRKRILKIDDRICEILKSQFDKLQPKTTDFVFYVENDTCMQHYFDILNSSDNKNLNYAQHVMIGKKWLREQLSTLGVLHLTNGGDIKIDSVENGDNIKYPIE